MQDVHAHSYDWYLGYLTCHQGMEERLKLKTKQELYDLYLIAKSGKGNT